jgi:tetratricopeptide (TPR) repeat protein
MQFIRSLVMIVALAAVVSPPAHAALGKSKTPEEKAAEQADNAQKEAEKLYGKAYQEIARGQKDLEKGNEKKARKRFQKAMGWSEEVVELKPDYFEAWNLVGFTARKLEDYDRSLAAYATCLELKPDYVPAREYLGKAHVELGQLDKAKEQLEWLHKLEAIKEAESLAALIEKAEAGDSDSGEDES